MTSKSPVRILIHTHDPSFPYYESEPQKYLELVSSYFKLHLEGGESGSGPHGYIPSWVVQAMPWDGCWNIDHTAKKIAPAPSVCEMKSQNEIIRDTLSRARKSKKFKVLEGWRNELYPIYGHSSTTEKNISIERAASALFGINTYGVHMTLYTYINQVLKIWVPRRATRKQTYGGMLDNTVAGGIATGEKVGFKNFVLSSPKNQV